MTNRIVVDETVDLQSPQTLLQNSSAEEIARTEEELLSDHQFSQTLQTASSMDLSLKLTEEENRRAERAHWVLDAPKPPSLWCKLQIFICGSSNPLTQEQHNKNKHQHQQYYHGSPRDLPFKFLKNIFPILTWGKSYNVKMFRNDLFAGLTLASLCIPQSIGYATLAKLDPQFGLYTSVVPPIVYALMGSSRDIAIGPVAVVSLLLSVMIQKLEDPITNAFAYKRLALTVTFFVGVFQTAFGILRLGFLVDLLSHAAIVGFMGGAAIIIGLQQMKGLLGITHFTNKTDILSVLKAVWNSLHHSDWNVYNCILGCSFLCFILTTRFMGRRKKKFFWLSTIAPLASVILSTLIVFLTRADNHGVKIVKHIKSGLNPSSIHELQFTGAHTAEVVKVGLTISVIALTEAIAVGRSFASIKGYNLDGNKEMLAMGVMNLAGSLSSCYVATGSFSRTAVNFSAGCETVVSNLVMAVTVILSLQFLTRLLYFTPVAILASIILSALPSLIDFSEAYNIWKLDKLDFLACIGAFFGVLFVSVEIGLLVAVGISFAKVVLLAIQPGTEVLGQLPGTEIFVDTNQYPIAVQIPGVLVNRIKSSLLCFANANFIAERIIEIATKKHGIDAKENVEGRIQLVVLDMSNLMNIDTTALSSLEELQRKLALVGIELAVINPRWQVINKLKMANLVNKIGRRVYLTVGEAIDAFLSTRMA